MSGEYDVVQCYRCKAYHFDQYGRCPDCGASVGHQCDVSDRHFPKALRQEAERLRNQAKKYEGIADKTENEWKERRKLGKPRFAKE